ncbi:MAG: DNA ligase D [Acidobacteriota bacterium]
MAKWREDPASVRPMLASLTEPPIAQRGQLYEPKYDGIRALADLRPPPAAGAPPHVALYSRNGREKQAQFPAVTSAFAAIARRLAAPLLLDGEIVALDPAGSPLGFQSIQGRIHLTSSTDIAQAERDHPAAIIVFDLLRDGDVDLRGEPLANRRLRLQERLQIPARLRTWIRLSEVAVDDGRALLSRAKREGWEGLIVKDGQSVYQSGRRTPAWKKLKLLKQQEFVIGGWTEPRQTRSHFGALLVGYYDDNGALRWAGSVGTGFDQETLERVGSMLLAREQRTSPFADAFKTVERAHWLQPQLVVEVRFTEWTSDGLLRQPVYLGMRDDKNPKEVRREEARKAGPAPLPAHPRYRRNRRVPSASDQAAAPDARATAAPLKTTPLKATALKTTPTAAAPIAAALAGVSDQLTALEKARKDGDLSLPGGDILHVTNLSKLLWPALKITKGDLLRYYVGVSSLLLPCVDDRPLIMKRFPNGVDSHAFYQQRHPETPPAGVRRHVLPEDVEPIDEDGPRDRLIGGSLTTLLYMTQLAAISQDPWFSRVAHPFNQDYTAIDLDPGDGTSFDRVLDTARWVKEELDGLGIPAWPKTSGASGLHIYIPLPKGTSYETGQLLAQIIATAVAAKHPKVATIERAVKKRLRGTVYVDYLQNILGKTLATAYSARASEYAGVSTPLTWEEVARGVDPRDFTLRSAPARFAEVGDLWKAFRTSKPLNIKQLLRRRL